MTTIYTTQHLPAMFGFCERTIVLAALYNEAGEWQEYFVATVITCTN